LRRDQQTGEPNDEPRHGRGDVDEARDLARYAARRVNAYDAARRPEPVNIYNTHGSPEGEAARNRTPAFGQGGRPARKKRRSGGKAQGEFRLTVDSLTA
jgi:hypothetical protein